MRLTLAQASIIVDKALEKGRELGLKPLTLAVLDAGGHLTALKREDGASLLRPEIAGGKAWGALGMGFGGREFARRPAGNPAFVQALSAASSGRIVPVPGGVLIRDRDGQIIDAVRDQATSPTMTRPAQSTALNGPASFPTEDPA
jgi:uncharacterized protein GlcG (DUF336 family)